MEQSGRQRNVTTTLVRASQFPKISFLHKPHKNPSKDILVFKTCQDLTIFKAPVLPQLTSILSQGNCFHPYT